MDCLSVRLKNSNVDTNANVWKDALNHLVSTYSPSTCVVHVPLAKVGIRSGLGIGSEDEPPYVGIWNKSKAFLTISRYAIRILLTIVHRVHEFE